jgi:hypothetical protein
MAGGVCILDASLGLRRPGLVGCNELQLESSPARTLGAGGAAASTVGGKMFLLAVSASATGRAVVNNLTVEGCSCEGTGVGWVPEVLKGEIQQRGYGARRHRQIKSWLGASRFPNLRCIVPEDSCTHASGFLHSYLFTTDVQLDPDRHICHITLQSNVGREDQEFGRQFWQQRRRGSVGESS